MDCRGGGSNSRSHGNLREPSGNHQHRHNRFPSVIVKITMLVAVVGLTRLALYRSDCHTQLMQRSYSLSALKNSEQQGNPSPPSSTTMQRGVPSSSHKLRSKDVYGIDDENKLKRTLKRAVMKDQNTVIITTINAAWTEPNSIFDLFMESFRIGNQTQSLFKTFGCCGFGPKGLLSLLGRTSSLFCPHHSRSRLLWPGILHECRLFEDDVETD
ncbi:UNVERIFIED_CONTAM: hypothetical protein Sradi_1725200 [Sesamum radiatum]|uniref:Nucleotide-diphospho-sugar transferase domain-containing protein n=1 Tax=Sesamum radiatum TaxID=300843 RepID=A0AAW2TSF3_SESRA